jgi:hypothetical protein
MLAVSTSAALGFASVPECPETVTVKEELGFNPCYGRHMYTELAGFANSACFDDDLNPSVAPGIGPQAGADITEGVAGLMEVAANQHPILDEYQNTALCPVNVHWHMGAEHRSEGEFDEDGKSPETEDDHGRRLAGDTEIRHGHKCHHYDNLTPEQKEPYEWKYCKDMKVGETYEIHWPHSAAGACGTKWQYQSKFYDGVFCNMDAVMGVLGMATEEAGAPVPTYIGVQGQVFTIVNDDAYKLDLNMAGAIMGGEYWSDVARYTGSTTGTSRDNEICSNYAPITWQVDRKCHMIAASSFDALCKEMKNNKEEKGGDDMEHDLHAHGARETVWANLTAGTPGR